jgi:hypothetical protein
LDELGRDLKEHRASRAAVPAVLPDYPDLTPTDLLDRMLVETVGTVATQAGHGESANLDLRGRFDVQWILGRPTGLERSESRPGGYEARFPNQARPIIFLGLVSSKHFMAKVDTGRARTRALPPRANRGYLGLR